VVFATAAFGSVTPETDRPLLGICESATAPVGPGDPPTNVVVDWENGTRTTHVSGIGLVQLGAATQASLLGTVMQYVAGLPNPGSRLRGPCVLQGDVLSASGAALAGELVVLKTPLGYLGFPSAYVVPVSAE
jgi:hypothetical protein